MSHSTKRGVTLIELLVSITIIALLLSIILPSLAYFKSISKDIKCQNQLRNFGQAIHVYIADYGNFPVVPATNLPYNDDFRFYETISTVMDIQKPSPTEVINGWVCPWDNKNAWYFYGQSYVYMPAMLAQIRHNTNMLSLYELNRNYPLMQDMYPFPERSNKKMDIVFFDGSVNTLTSQEYSHLPWID